ncbi:calumenin-B-like [Drosophila obscura]|uniref:calumenin-B-like n=1 Tax=Drosophila obscura TaxID=7282 RepID=UPI001BB1137D|nr:calumenin-B-like [Drosophila obscura]
MWPMTGALWLLLIAAFAANKAAADGKQPDLNTPEEMRRRLGLLVDRMDEDSNGLVSLTELKEWLSQTSRRYIENDVSRLWKRLSPEKNATITWDVYQDSIYGFGTGNDLTNYKSLINRDRRRWKVADKNRDDCLNREEFSAFLHSEDHPAMRDVVLKEMFDDLDVDRDGKISLVEYVFDMYQPATPDEQPPEWVGNERDVFVKFLDLNGDGHLNEDEVRQWIAPHGLGQSDSEAQHLLTVADADGDMQLTKSEVLANYDTFYGSPATEYGDALIVRHDHDEL